MATLLRVRSVTTGVAGTPWYNNTYFDETSGSAADAIAKLEGFWVRAAPWLKNELTVTIDPEVAVFDTIAGKVTGYQEQTSNPIVGTSTADLLPRASALLFEFLTSEVQNGRKVLGKMFISGLTTSYNVPASGTVLPVLATASATAWREEVLRTDVGPRQVIYSKRGGTAYPVRDVTTWGEWATMRSRRD